MSKVYVFYLRRNASNKSCNQIYAIAQNKNERDYFKKIKSMWIKVLLIMSMIMHILI